MAYKLLLAAQDRWPRIAGGAELVPLCEPAPPLSTASCKKGARPTPTRPARRSPRPGPSPPEWLLSCTTLGHRPTAACWTATGRWAPPPLYERVGDQTFGQWGAALLANPPFRLGDALFALRRTDLEYRPKNYCTMICTLEAAGGGGAWSITQEDPRGAGG